jgi:flagellum-specific peptidoglycan hydrolase FlgJ
MQSAIVYNKMNIFGEKGFYKGDSDYSFTLEVDRNKLSKN